MNPYLLTICIATHNRADHLKNTLNNIVDQTKHFNDIQILITDGNSTDETELVVNKFTAFHPDIKYLKLTEKGGVDKDYDLAVQNAQGKYCWLFTDDDLIKAGSIKKIHGFLSENPDLMIINSAICDYSLSHTLKRSAIDIQENIRFNFMNSGRDAFFKICGTYISFIGAIIIKRSLWTENPRSNFYGTRFIHVGVISTLKESTNILAIAEPFIKIRLGNAEWRQISFKIWTQLWPNLIWSIPHIEESTKRSICKKDPSKCLKFLFWLRGLGHYSKKEFDVYISPKPQSINKIIAVSIALLPQSIPYFIYYIYAHLKRDDLLIYQVTDGKVSRNQWHSSD